MEVSEEPASFGPEVDSGTGSDESKTPPPRPPPPQLFPDPIPNADEIISETCSETSKYNQKTLSDHQKSHSELRERPFIYTSPWG